MGHTFLLFAERLSDIIALSLTSCVNVWNAVRRNPYQVRGWVCLISCLSAAFLLLSLLFIFAYYRFCVYILLFTMLKGDLISTALRWYFLPTAFFAKSFVRYFIIYTWKAAAAASVSCLIPALGCELQGERFTTVPGIWQVRPFFLIATALMVVVWALVILLESIFFFKLWINYVAGFSLYAEYHLVVGSSFIFVYLFVLFTISWAFGFFGWYWDVDYVRDEKMLYWHFRLLGASGKPNRPRKWPRPLTWDEKLLSFQRKLYLRDANPNKPVRWGRGWEQNTLWFIYAQGYRTSLDGRSPGIKARFWLNVEKLKRYLRPRVAGRVRLRWAWFLIKRIKSHHWDNPIAPLSYGLRRKFRPDKLFVTRKQVPHPPRRLRPIKVSSADESQRKRRYWLSWKKIPRAEWAKRARWAAIATWRRRWHLPEQLTATELRQSLERRLKRQNRALKFRLHVKLTKVYTFTALFYFLSAVLALGLYYLPDGDVVDNCGTSAEVKWFTCWWGDVVRPWLAAWVFWLAHKLLAIYVKAYGGMYRVYTPDLPVLTKVWVQAFIKNSFTSSKFVVRTLVCCAYNVPYAALLLTLLLLIVMWVAVLPHFFFLFNWLPWDALNNLPKGTDLTVVSVDMLPCSSIYTDVSSTSVSVCPKQIYSSAFSASALHLFFLYLSVAAVFAALFI